MADIENALFRTQLMHRQQRLQSFMQSTTDTQRLQSLLDEVDRALDRIEKGTFGLCETCHDPIEPERLMADPLTCYCVDHLTEKERRALQQDLDLALQIQSALLPKREVNLHGWEAYYYYQPAGPVSGDYCDLIPLQNGTRGLLFLAGDVSGKGVAASLLMANLHAIFRALHSDTMGLEKLMERANRVFCENTMSAFYATLLCGIADESGKLEICNAGHCQPLLLRKDGIETLSTTGLPLGMFCDAQYSVCSFDIQPGDTLVIYTDGLTEARNHADEEYGHNRLLQTLQGCHQTTAKAVAAACVADVQGFIAGHGLSDDMTVLVLKRGMEENRAG